MKLMLEIPKNVTKTPVIAEVIIRTGVTLNIERARVDSDGGQVVVSVADEYVDEVRTEFKRLGIKVRMITHPVVMDDGTCIDCGACISVCPTDVFYFDEEKKVHLNEDNCIICGLCIDMCPVDALRIVD